MPISANRNLSLSCRCHLYYMYLICCVFVLLRCLFLPFFFSTVLNALTTTTTTHAMVASADRSVLLSSSCACSRVKILVIGPPQAQDQQQKLQQQFWSKAQASVVECHCRECRKFHTSGCIRYFPLSCIIDDDTKNINSDNNTTENDNDNENIQVVLEQQQQQQQQQQDNAVLSIPHECAELGPVHRLVCRYCSSKLATIIVASETPTSETQDWTETSQKSTLQKTSSLLSKQQLPSSQVLLNLGPLDEGQATSTTTTRQLFTLLSKKWQQPSAITQWHMQSRAHWLIQARPMQRRGRNNKRQNQDLTVPLILTGSCACGQCRYQIRLPYMATEFQHCYCRLCRQFSGSAFQTWMPVERSDFQWMPSRLRRPPWSNKASPQTETQGSSFEPPLIRTTPHGRRHVCPTCHGVLTIVYDDQPDVVWPAAGGLDDEYDDPSLGHGYDKRNTEATTNLTATATAETNQPIGGNPTMIHLYRVCHICCAYCPPWYQLPKDGLKRISEAC